MLTAYLDESGHEGKEVVIIAGFLGTEQQWANCEAMWKIGLGKRKALHLGSLQWNKRERVRKLLAKMGPIPHEAGLQAIFSAVKVSDYDDLVEGTHIQKLLKGYYIALLGIIEIISNNIPEDETFKLVLDVQTTYELRSKLIFDSSSSRMTSDGRQKLASLEYIANGLLIEPADYLAYALVQLYRDDKSERYISCLPILKNVRPALVQNLCNQREAVREFVRGLIAQHPNLMRRVDEPNE